MKATTNEGEGLTPLPKPRKRVLGNCAYLHAAIIADAFCDPAQRPDMHPYVRDIIERGFRDACALTGVAVPVLSENKRTWRRVRQAYIDMRRAAECRFEEAQEGYASDLHSDALYRVDGYSLTGRTARIAAGLRMVLHAFWFADDYEQPVNKGDLRKRLNELQEAIEWNAALERHGAEAVRRAIAERDAAEAEAVRAARASIPTVAETMRQLPIVDTEDAMRAELGAEWQRFIEEIGEASR